MSDINQSALAISIKKQAHRLNIAFWMLNTKNEILQERPPIKAPTLAQCQEIYAKAYGFNTHNGAIQAADQFYEFDQLKFTKALKETLRKNNLDRLQIMDVIESTVFEDQFYSKLYRGQELAEFLRLFPVLKYIQPPKMNYLDGISIHYGPSFYNDQVSEDHEPIVEMLFNLIVENIQKIDFYDQSEGDDTGILDIPLSLFYNHDISDVHLTQSYIRWLCEIFNSSMFCQAKSGMLEVTDLKQSKIMLTINKCFYRDIVKSNKLHTQFQELLAMFHEVLKVYHPAVINFKSRKQLEGKGLSQYYLYRNYFIRQLILCDREFNQEPSTLIDNLNLNEAIKTINPHNTALINEALEKFDNLVAELRLLPELSQRLKQEFKDSRIDFEDAEQQYMDEYFRVLNKHLYGCRANYYHV